jgi:putative flippase GtrA
LLSKLSVLLVEKRQEFVRFLKFCVVGVIGTAIDFGVFNLMHNVLHVHEVLSNTLSVSCAIVNNYLWSRYWVYPETKDRQGGRKFAQFVVVSMIAWALNTTILWTTDRWFLGEEGLLVGIVALLAAAAGVEHRLLSSNAAKVIATGIVLFWNFFANRLWTFRDVDQVKPVIAAVEDTLTAARTEARTDPREGASPPDGAYPPDGVYPH